VILPALVAVGALGVLVLEVLAADDQPPPVAAIDFDIDASGNFARAAQRISFMNFMRRPGAVPEILPSTNSELGIVADGCSPTVDAVISVDPDPRWWLALKASRLGKSQPLVVRQGSNNPVAVSPGSVAGLASVSIPGDVDGVEVFIPRGNRRLPIRASAERLAGAPEDFTVIKFKIPDRALRGVVLRSVLGQRIAVAFQAPWVHPKGFMTCYVAIPALLAGQAPAFLGLGTEGLATDSGGITGPRGPPNGASRLELSSGTLSPSASRPPPNAAAITPTWTCHRDVRRAQSVSDDCHSTAVIEESGRETWQQVLLVVLGAVGSAGLIGVAGGLRRLLVPLD